VVGSRLLSLAKIFYTGIYARSITAQNHGTLYVHFLEG
jgi:hypothetical protein